MYVYIWKTPDGQPFYVGLTKTLHRTNPKNAGGRNWLCRQKLVEVGLENVVVEFHTVPSIIEGQELERKLITEYGRVQLSNGPLTNLQGGGNGAHGMSEQGKAKLRERLKNPNDPVYSAEARAKQRARMQAPDVQAKLRGDANPAKKPEVRAKLKAIWANPEFRAKMIAAQSGKPKHSPEEKQRRRERLLDPLNPMREYHKVLNSNPAIAAKRAATLRSPEQRTRQSEAMKANWAKRKAIIV
jgi:hypothetical protein